MRIARGGLRELGVGGVPVGRWCEYSFILGVVVRREGEGEVARTYVFDCFHAMSKPRRQLHDLGLQPLLRCIPSRRLRYTRRLVIRADPARNTRLRRISQYIRMYGT